MDEALGDRAVLFLRPGVTLGRSEYVGRLSWWLARAARPADPRTVPEKEARSAAAPPTTRTENPNSPPTPS
ncbi:hypothetical protein ACF09C_02685 [Streptomyces sp. NPDC014870]|uniref:hypothetical protein n=1 Tax=Streptomyces sp. NPDC014870 TaxID=3364925 RepID=UPI0036FFBAAD